MQTAKHSPHYQSPLPKSTAAKKRGRGVAMGYWPGAPLKSSVYANVNPDGTVSLIEGNTDIGGTRASLAMQLAETLGIPYESVKPQVVDTDSVGYNDVTGGSRITFASGLAVIEAGNDIIRQIKERAARFWSLSPEDAETVDFKDGVVIGPEESQRLSFAEAAGKLTRGNSPLVGRATVAPKSAGMSFGCHICDVEVDAETGKVDVLRYTAIQDAGKAIHPSYVEGQMQGGAAQGIGWALNEEYVFDDNGRMLNANFLDYRMATSLDLPMIETIVVEVPHAAHPFGVRGVGETPIVPPLAAVANAVSHALNHRFTDLPLSPRRIVEETLGL
jgi:CO/xanthine dehydrogenase Mo-binding subunit